MKKALLVFSVAISALLSHAEYLYWQVGDTSEVEGVTKGTLYAKDGLGNTHVVSSYYYAYNPDTGDYDWIAATSEDTTNSWGTEYAADISEYASSGYSYYVELSNGTEVLARSNEITYGTDTYRTYTSSASTVTELPAVAEASVWHASDPGGGGGYNPVPEPTSAILVLFGAAMLGLKRKQRRLI